MEKIKVIFRKIENEMVAFFPELPANPGYMLSYQHIGQHGEADLGFFFTTEKANLEEYSSLLKELKSIYSDCELLVRQKLHYRDLTEKAWKR